MVTGGLTGNTVSQTDGNDIVLNTFFNVCRKCCFARNEMSEIPLLETNQKISAVSRAVGFSTTAYYEKFFRE